MPHLVQAYLDFRSRDSGDGFPSEPTEANDNEEVRPAGTDDQEVRPSGVIGEDDQEVHPVGTISGIELIDIFSES